MLYIQLEVKLLKNLYLQLEIKSSAIGFGADTFISNAPQKKYSKKEYPGYGLIVLFIVLPLLI